MYTHYVVKQNKWYMCKTQDFLEKVLCRLFRSLPLSFEQKWNSVLGLHLRVGRFGVNPIILNDLIKIESPLIQLWSGDNDTYYNEIVIIINEYIWKCYINFKALLVDGMYTYVYVCLLFVSEPICMNYPLKHNFHNFSLKYIIQHIFII